MIRQAIVDTAFSQVGNYEKSNKNDGSKINKYALKNGGRYGDAYCSWGAIYCFHQNYVKPNANGAAVSWIVPEQSIIRKFGKLIKDIPVRDSDLAISRTWEAKRKRYQYHVEIITNYNTRNEYCYTVGFNTWSKFEHGKRRQGVWIHKRLKVNLIVCNQLQYFWYEKDKVHHVAALLEQLQRKRVSKN